MSVFTQLKIDQEDLDDSWETIRSGGEEVLIDLVDVPSFLEKLPPDLRPATMVGAQAGLPKNVCVGGRFKDVRPDILNVRARIRYLVVDNLTNLKEYKKALEAWRCSFCGHRGTYPRPRLCPHAHGLCGDAKLLPEIHWIVCLGYDVGKKKQTLAEKYGVLFMSKLP